MSSPPRHLVFSHANSFPAGSYESLFEAWRAAGFTVHTAESDWVLDGTHAELQRQLLAGWAGAARELAPGDAAAIDAWLARRLTHVDAGASHIVVGHVDVLALAPVTSADGAAVSPR